MLLDFFLKLDWADLTCSLLFIWISVLKFFVEEYLCTFLDDFHKINTNIELQGSKWNYRVKRHKHF